MDKQFTKVIDFPIFSFDYGSTIQEIQKLKLKKLQDTTSDLQKKKNFLLNQSQAAQVIQANNQLISIRGNQLQSQLQTIRRSKQIVISQSQHLQNQLKTIRLDYQRKANSIQLQYRSKLEERVKQFQNKTWERAEQLSRQIQANHKSMQIELRSLLQQLQQLDQEFVLLNQQLQAVEIDSLKLQLKSKSVLKWSLN